MSKVSITKSKLDTLANTISAKSGVAAPLTLDQMDAAVQSIPSGGGIVISDTTDAAGGTVRTITAMAISGTKSITQNGTGIDVTEYAAVDVNVQGGSPSATQHVIHFVFTDSTTADVNVYYDDALIGTMITAYQPSTWTYNNKTVKIAELDGVEWYNINTIPIGVELIDFTAITEGYVIDSSGQVVAEQWYAVSDYTPIESGMTFSFTGCRWFYASFYDSSKTYISNFYIYSATTESPYNSNCGDGTLSSSIPANAAYIRISSISNPTSLYLSLIRTA